MFKEAADQVHISSSAPLQALVGGGVDGSAAGGTRAQFEEAAHKFQEAT